MPIDCLLSIRDESGSYYIYTYITLLSIFENTKEKLCIHIMHDDTVEHARQPLTKLVDSYDQKIVFHRVPDFDPATADILSRRFNLGTMYRYYAHEFIDAGKAIYLDSDIIVNRDIKELYDTPLGDHLLGGVLDHCSYWKNNRPRRKWSKKVKYLGLSREKYISAGLMLMNLDRIREISKDGNVFVKQTLRAISDGISLDYPDMDIINSISASIPQGVLLLDESFHLWHKALHLSLDELQGKIFHLVSKPDREFFPAHLLFWKYYAMSPFAGDMFERMSAAYTAKNMRVVRDYILNPKERRHAEDLLRHGLAGMLGRAVGRRLGLCGK